MFECLYYLVLTLQSMPLNDLQLAVWQMLPPHIVRFEVKTCTHAFHLRFHHQANANNYSTTPNNIINVHHSQFRHQIMFIYLLLQNKNQKNKKKHKQIYDVNCSCSRGIASSRHALFVFGSLRCPLAYR